jgi:hypothetical protein
VGHPMAGHLVLRYPNAMSAAVAYYTTDEFANRRSVKTPYRKPDDWAYKSTVADRLRFECAELDISRRFVRCTAVAQYDEYISVFGAPVSPYFLKLEQIEPILQAIDERMALHLNEADRRREMAPVDD